MTASKVFFTSLRTNPHSNLLDKMERLVRRAGIDTIDFDKRFAAIKIHFGEPGNVAYIRPNFAARMADILRSLGAKPFLTDCNTLYSGRRSNAVDHLQSAMENGFNPISARCNVIIADGLKGTDYREIPIDGEYCKAPKIGAAIADADIIISMTHFKGHEQATSPLPSLPNDCRFCRCTLPERGFFRRPPGRRQNLFTPLSCHRTLHHPSGRKKDRRQGRVTSSLPSKSASVMGVTSGVPNSMGYNPTFSPLIVTE